MLTVDDLAGLEIFAGVPPGELERLAKAAADVHLAEGEFLTHEGAARALFVVIEGRIGSGSATGSVRRIWTGG
ncbi:MAG: hypothetical protein U1E59_12900 [Amaricoccus sp.]